MAMRITMKRVRQVAAEYRPLPKVHELTNSIWASENANIRVHAHHDDVVNLSFIKEIQHLLTVIADRIVQRDIDERCLARPRIWRLGWSAAFTLA